MLKYLRKSIVNKRKSKSQEFFFFSSITDDDKHLPVKKCKYLLEICEIRVNGKADYLQSRL